MTILYPCNSYAIVYMLYSKKNLEKHDKTLSFVISICLITIKLKKFNKYLLPNSTVIAGNFNIRNQVTAVLFPFPIYFSVTL